jgi:DNA-binding response OmpR family regulator
MPQSRVLLADNDPDFLDTRAEYLETSNYVVLKAHTPGEARKLLTDAHVHLAILDIRMINDDDDRDTSGLTLAKDPTFRSIPKIMLTGFPSYEYVREALSPTSGGPPAAVQFLARHEGPEVMLQVVAEVLSQHTRLNWNLAINWPETLSLFYLATLIEPELNGSLIANRAGELADLLRRLFYESSQITIVRLLAIGERKVILSVFAFSEVGVSSEFTLACGQKDMIQHEEENFRRFAPKTTGEGGTTKYASAETIHFAAIAYTLMGANLEEVTTLAEFYRQNPAERVIPALDNLFETTLARWHRQSVNFKVNEISDKLFTAFLNVNMEILARPELEPRLKAIQSKTSGDILSEFGEASLGRLFDFLEGAVPLSASFQCGLSYRYLRGETVLVDPEGKVWLIDFAHVGQGPLAYDYISLEKLIKFELLTTLELSERYELEQYLLSKPDLGEQVKLDALGPEIQKAVKVISYIRHRAAGVTDQDIKSYQVGLLFSSLEALAAYKPEIYYTRRELIYYSHHLLSLMLLCQELMVEPSEYLNPYSPWLDNNKPDYEVWVEGQWITLTQTEYKLLRVLYRQAIDNPDNPSCTYKAISDEVWGSFDRDRGDDANIQGLIKRLREKIQSDNSTHHYIENVRGVGYRLNLKHHSVLD